MLTDQASTRIAAPAEVVYDLVADVTSTGQRSPECRHLEWLGEPARPVASARFRGRNRWRGYTWWRQATIVQADRGHEFVFATEPGRGIYHDTTTWAYRFELAGEGTTRVTESYLFRAPWWIQAMDTALGRPKALRRGMERTLANLKHAAEQQSATDSKAINHAGKDDGS
jgi:hypothetical protein